MTRRIIAAAVAGTAILPIPAALSRRIASACELAISSEKPGSAPSSVSGVAMAKPQRMMPPTN
jgi:hypothetical protein